MKCSAFTEPQCVSYDPKRKAKENRLHVCSFNILLNSMYLIMYGLSETYISFEQNIDKHFSKS